MTTDLERFRDHARHMSKHDNTPKTDVHLWETLANEIDEYLNTPNPEPTTESLFDH